MKKTSSLFRVVMIFCLLAYQAPVRAAPGADAPLVFPGGTSAQMKASVTDMIKLITAGGYVGGMGFGVGAIVKFNAHPDTPERMAMALFFIAVALTFLPSITKSAGSTLFGDEPIAGVEGITQFKFAVASGVVTKIALEHAVTPENKSGLKDALEFMVSAKGAAPGSVSVEERSEAILIGALVAMHELSAKLSDAQKEELATLITHAIVNGLAETETRSENLGPDVERLIGAAIASLHDLKLSRTEQADLVGSLVKGADQGLADHGALVHQKIDVLDHFTKVAVQTLRQTDILPTEIDRAVGSIASGALDSLYAGNFTSAQYLKGTERIVLGTLAGLEDYLNDKRWRQLADAPSSVVEAYARSLNALMESLSTSQRALAQNHQELARTLIEVSIRRMEAARRHLEETRPTGNDLGPALDWIRRSRKELAAAVIAR